MKNMNEKNFVTREEFNQKFEKLEKSFSKNFEQIEKKFTDNFFKMEDKFTDNFFKIDEKFDKLTESFDLGKFKNLNETQALNEKFDKKITTRIATLVTAIVFLISAGGTIGNMRVSTAEKIAELKHQIITTRIDGIEKQMNEEIDWLYETKAEKLELENLKK